MEIISTNAGGRKLFIITILLGSFLLFLVQPMVARMALPRLGGAPAVWNSAMLVYQALLLGGYAYAHRLSRETPRRQAIIQIGLLLFAALWLPLGLANFQPGQNASPIFWMPWLLVASIGPLFFAVAAQAPLMQRWYSLAGNEGEPYALYAASNIGSFSGLIAYPLIVEPLMPLRAQNLLWSAIYVLLVVIVGLCARAMWLNRSAQTQTLIATPTYVTGWKRRLYWIALAAVPSGLMLSTTTHLTTDLVAMPLIWVIPLALYLLSFSIAFANKRTVANALTFATPPLLLLTAASTFMPAGGAIISALLVNLSLLFFVAIALHSEMYRTRPEPAQLTSFYLMMSVGGVIGGFFCAILAPLIFDWTWEHPILIIAAALLIPQKRLFMIGGESFLDAKSGLRIAVILALIACGIGLFGGISMPAEIGGAKTVLIVIIICIGILVTGQRYAYALVMAAVLFANGGSYNLEASMAHARMRSYFGIYTINTDGKSRWLMHGTTMHGMQLLADPKRPISYYGPASGVGLAMAKAEALYGKNASIGVVGLGTGTLGCYSKPSQKWHFFEIDPLIIDIARERGGFTFLSRCAPDAAITLGDARLTLAKVKPASFDVLAIDAFSSDAIPLHLLTAQAFAIYGRALKPGGTLLVHISNRYIDLNPVVAAQAKQGAWNAAIRIDSPPQKAVDDGERPSLWIALNRDAGMLTKLTGPLSVHKSLHYDRNQWLYLDTPTNKVWTDDYASVLPHLSIWKTLK
jgi:SAM-dependent methyltransferase